ncbi:MAG: hypothetical protein QM447_02315, partial [Thermotogota bacterium]|nr:hypothetical protein [Thermotogota bacterium]
MELTEVASDVSRVSCLTGEHQKAAGHETRPLSIFSVFESIEWGGSELYSNLGHNSEQVAIE